MDWEHILFKNKEKIAGLIMIIKWQQKKQISITAIKKLNDMHGFWNDYTLHYVNIYLYGPQDDRVTVT